MINAGDIQIREMNLGDGEFVLEIRNDDSTRTNLHNPEEFTLDQFEEWHTEKRPLWFIASYESEDFGYFRTDCLHKGDKSIQVGMDIHPNFRGRGLAEPSFRKLFSYLRGAYNIKWVWLRVLKKNAVARHIYEKLGFQYTQAETHNGDEHGSFRMNRQI